MPPATPPAVPLPAPVPLPPPVLELRDFSDRLPAVVVKELRQGLRAKMFIIPFLCLHGLLVLATLQGTRNSTGFFWHCLIIMLVALLPMRNVGALSEERQACTLDTLLLTRLTPWRIVSGKWSATFALTLLTAVSALPYLLVRYLNGGSSFVQEGAVLAGLVFLSGALTGGFTALSAMGSGLARHILAVITLLLSYRFLAFYLFALLAEDAGEVTAVMGLVTCAAIWATTFFLWHAAATIAPEASNLTTPRRLTTLAAVAFTGLLLFLLPGAKTYGVNILIVILTFSSLVETSGRLVSNPAVDATFARRGVPGQLAAFLFYPGWAAGVVFSAVLWAITAAILFLDSGRRGESVALAAAYSFFPVCIAAPFFLRRYGGAALMILIMLTVQILLALANSLLREDLDFLMRIIPTPQRNRFEPAMALVWATIAILMAMPALFRQERRISRESGL